MVTLSRIYTRTGDAGQTRLVNMTKTSKTDLRVAAYGDVDGANSAIGVALALGALPPDIVEVLTRVQNDMFDLGSDLGNPLPPDGDHTETPTLRITQDYVDRLEGWCDEFNERLAPLRSFILPGGSTGAALLHVARTDTRRAERGAWAATEGHPGTVNPLAVKYLNRLSDLLFILARAANVEYGDVLWVPGGERTGQ